MLALPGSGDGLMIYSAERLVATCGYEGRWSPSNDYVIRVGDDVSGVPTITCVSVSLSWSQHLVSAVECALM
jgi:hypothetical protein